MAKEPNDKLRKTPGIAPDSAKPLKELFGGDKKHFEPIEDDEDDVVAAAPAAKASDPLPSLVSSSEKVQAGDSSQITQDPGNNQEATGAPAAKPAPSKLAPSKPAAKGIKSHWASLASALGLRKKETESVAPEKPDVVVAPAAAQKTPTETRRRR